MLWKKLVEKVPSGATAQSYVNVTSFSEADLQDAVATIGPVAIISFTDIEF
jgi:hypothetical protein